MLAEHVRSSRTLTWTQIADALDKTDGAVRHWRNGTRDIKLAEFVDLCNAAGASPVNILTQALAIEGSQSRAPAARGRSADPRLRNISGPGTVRLTRRTG